MAQQNEPTGRKPNHFLLGAGRLHCRLGRRHTRGGTILAVVISASLCLAANSSAADGLYFPKTSNITDLLVQTINAETVRVDIGVWLLTERAISTALVNRIKARVPVRLIGDRAAMFEVDPRTKEEFYWLASQGIPIRLRYQPTSFPELVHWKGAIFAEQRVVAFGSANYTPFELASASATNYKDEIVLFTNDIPLVNAFEAMFDRMWNDTEREPRSQVGPPYLRNWDDACARESACSDYWVRYPNRDPMRINTARLVPDYPSPPEMVWGQGPDFNARLVDEINREMTAVDLATYRLSATAVTDALIAKSQSGVPVRVIIEPEQYNNRSWPEFWLVRANVDRLSAAGIPVKQRAHVGLMHMKMLITSQVATIASSNISENWQRDHNYFLPATAKPAVHQAMRRYFEAMWNDPAAFTALVPLPPDAPTLVSPSPGMTRMPNTALEWNRTPFATSYDVYLGLSESTLSRVANVPALLINDPPASYSWVPQSPLRASTKYYWRIIARTFANQTASSAVWTFTTPSFDGDFNGDGKADVVVFRPSDGTWYLKYSGAGAAAGVQWGNGSDRPVRGDFDGDGKADVAVFRPSNGTWYIVQSSTGAATGFQWGNSNDLPEPGDYDGDGRSDIAVFRPSDGTWYIVNSSTGAPMGVQWGNSSDVGVPADYNGDGRVDIAVFRPSNGTWYIRYSGTGATAGVQWGNGSDIPVPGDYDGDDRTDVAVFRPSNGTWYIVNSSTGVATGAQWGNGSDIPIPGDYDGDGRTDVAVFRPSSGTWYIINSSTGMATGVQWGGGGDVPILKP